MPVYKSDEWIYCFVPIFYHTQDETYVRHVSDIEDFAYKDKLV